MRLKRQKQRVVDDLVRVHDSEAVVGYFSHLFDRLTRGA